jgi:hypothetical protein
LPKKRCSEEDKTQKLNSVQLVLVIDVKRYCIGTTDS